MKFLSGFLKFLGILLMLIGAAGGAALCVFAVMDDQLDLILLGVLIFLCFLFVALGILGTGTALSQIIKLKKKVELLEQRLWATPIASPAPVVTSVSAPAIQPETLSEPVADPIAEALAPAKKSNAKRWLPVIIGGALLVVAILVVAISGGSKGNDQPVMEEVQQPVELPPMDIVEEAPTEAPAMIDVVDLSVGSSLNTGWVEMTFDEILVEENIQKSVTIDNVTRVTGPDPISGQTFLCLSGTIKNTSTSPLPVYDFFLGRFDVNGYTYDVSANDCDILSPDGSPESEIDPLMTYEYRIYTAIPLELQEFIHAGEPCSFTFGFYDGFDNKDLSYNQAFSENPIAECPYQFFVSFQ